MTGAMFIAECLKQEGVTKVFGQCGHTNYALIDACHRLGIEYVSFRHEQMAAHAADAYFRVSHKLAVLNVHLSPGLTNALTGVVTAAADSTPMLVFAGNTPSYHHAREPHQGIRFHADASQGDIFRPFCKRVWRVDDAKLLPDVMPRALNVAQTGRPGAVLDRRADGRVLARRSSARRRSPWPVAPNTVGASAPHDGIAEAAQAAGDGVEAGHLRRQRRAAVRSDATNCASWRNCRCAGRDDADGEGRVSGRSSAVARHDGHLGHARGERDDARGRRRPGDRHGFRRGRLQLVEARVSRSTSRRRA